MAEATFLMSTWNGAEFLRPALDSLLAQTVPDWRLVAVDDGSSDGTGDILAEYERDDRVRVERFDANRSTRTRSSRPSGWLASTRTTSPRPSGSSASSPSSPRTR